MTETPNPVDTAAYLLPVNGPTIGASGAIVPDEPIIVVPPVTSLTIAGPQTAAQGFTLSVRDALTTFPVPVFRPTTVNTGLALDLMPNGSPGNSGDAPLSVCWFDVCNADTLSGAHAVATARVGCGTSLSEFGSYAFSGASLNPLALTMGGVIAMNLANNGYQWDFSANFPVNGLSYTHHTNSSAGTGAYAEFGVVNSNGATLGLGYFRAYGGGWTAVAGDANFIEVGSNTTAGIGVTANGGATGVIRFIAGGFTPGGPGAGQTVAQFNPVGAANAPGSLVANYPPILPIYTITTLPTGTAALTGARAFVSNGLLATGWGNAVAGAGSVLLPVFCIGTGGWYYG